MLHDDRHAAVVDALDAQRHAGAGRAAANAHHRRPRRKRFAGDEGSPDLDVMGAVHARARRVEEGPWDRRGRGLRAANVRVTMKPGGTAEPSWHIGFGSLVARAYAAMWSGSRTPGNGRAGWSGPSTGADDQLAVALEPLDGMRQRVTGHPDAVPRHAERGQLVERGAVLVGVEVIVGGVTALGVVERDVDLGRSRPASSTICQR